MGSKRQDVLYAFRCHGTLIKLSMLILPLCGLVVVETPIDYCV